MKILKITGHPIAIICSFLLIMISGEAFGGPYILYIFLGLPHGAFYALTAAGGIALLSLSLALHDGHKKINLKSWIIITGILLLLSSLYFFFQHDRLRYNHDTFLQTVPSITLLLFGTSIVTGLIVNIDRLLGGFIKRDHFPPADPLRKI